MSQIALPEILPHTASASAGGSQSLPRVALQQRAPGTIRRHFVRSASRVAVLLAGDAAAFLTIRTGVRALRDGALASTTFATTVGELFPQGFLGGWKFAVALLIGLSVAGAYQPGDRRRDARRIFVGVALAAGLALWERLWAVGLGPVVLQYAATIASVGVSMMVMRKLIDVLVLRYAERLLPSERVLFVGDPAEAQSRMVAERLSRAERMEVIGWVAPNRTAAHTPIAGAPWLGSADNIWDVLHEVGVDSVVLAGKLSREGFDLVVEAVSAAGCRLMASSRYEGVGRLRPTFMWYHRLPFVELTVPALQGRHLLVKRTLDMVGASLGLLLLAPLLGILAILIKLDSRGPVFFSQERVGHGGRVFRMFKFRTMSEDADAQKADIAHLNHTGDKRLFKIPNDPRITRVGARLRRWSLDELPQLWNVLIGDMSLVGPRPFFEGDLAGYDEHHFVRFGAKPGITGLWQVNGRSSVVEFEEVVRLDREYIEQWSLGLDMRILLRTVPTVFRRTGAY